MTIHVEIYSMTTLNLKCYKIKQKYLLMCNTDASMLLCHPVFKTKTWNTNRVTNSYCDACRLFSQIP